MRRLVVLLFGSVLACATGKGKDPSPPATLKDAMRGVAERLEPKKEKAVLVIPMSEPNKGPTQLGQHVGVLVTAGLKTLEGVVVLERKALDAVMIDRRAKLKDIEGDAKAIDFAKAAGADYVVVGVLTPNGRSYTLRARMLDIKDGDEAGAADTNFDVAIAPEGVAGVPVP